MIPQSFNEKKFLIRIKDNISSHNVRNIILHKINIYFCQTLEESNVSLIWLNLPIFQFFPLPSNQIIYVKFDSFLYYDLEHPPKICWQIINFKSSLTQKVFFL